MRHLIIAVLIVITILSIGIIEQIMLKDTLEDMQNMTDEIVKSVEAEDSEKTKILAHSLMKYYEDMTPMLALVFSHNEFRDIPTLIGELVGYADVGDTKEVVVRANVLISAIDSHLAILSLKIENIL